MKLFNKYDSANDANKNLVVSSAQDLRYRISTESKTWESSSDEAKLKYLETVNFLKDNIPSRYRDVTYEYFKLCVIVMNIHWETRSGSSLPEPKDYEQFFVLNYYGNILRMFRPALEEAQSNVFSYVGGSMYSPGHYPFVEMDNFVRNNWNTRLSDSCNSYDDDVPWVDRKNTTIYYSLTHNIRHNIGFVTSQYLTYPILADSWLSLEQARDVVAGREIKKEQLEDKYKYKFDYLEFGKALLWIIGFVVVVWIFVSSFSDKPNLDVPYDLDCSDIGETVWVGDYDPHGLDRDGDGWGCE